MLRDILPRPRYEEWHRQLILNLMRRFELAYPDRTGVWWLPNAMPQDEPPEAAEALWQDALAFAYTYEPALPEGVITRFIVRASE